MRFKGEVIGHLVISYPSGPEIGTLLRIIASIVNVNNQNNNKSLDSAIINPDIRSDQVAKHLETTLQVSSDKGITLSHLNR